MAPPSEARNFLVDDSSGLQEQAQLLFFVWAVSAEPTPNGDSKTNTEVLPLRRPLPSSPYRKKEDSIAKILHNRWTPDVTHGIHGKFSRSREEGQPQLVGMWIHPRLLRDDSLKCRSGRHWAWCMGCSAPTQRQCERPLLKWGYPTSNPFLTWFCMQTCLQFCPTACEGLDHLPSPLQCGRRRHQWPRCPAVVGQ